jgi:hypothetical protein
MCVQGAIAYKAIEALAKFMKIFTKKRMGMKRKSFSKEWVGVNVTAKRASPVPASFD